MLEAQPQNPFSRRSTRDDESRIDAFWSSLVRRPSTTLAPWRQYARSPMDSHHYWVNDDEQLALAESWTPCSYAGGLDFEHVTEIPCLTLCLDVESESNPEAYARLVDRHRARLKLPEAHFVVHDPTSEQLHFIWWIRPLHKPPKDAAGSNHFAWTRIRSSWRMAQLKLALAFELLGARPTPAIFTPKLPLPHPEHRRAHLGLDATILLSSDVAPYVVQDVSAPLDKTEFERRAFKILRPARRLPGFLAGAKGWVNSKAFLAAVEPKLEGARHPAAVTIACCLRWSGCEGPAIEKFLRSWSATHLSQCGFPAVRARGDEISLLTEWAVRNLVPGGPRRKAEKRGNYLQKAATLSALAAFLMSVEAHRLPWVGTQRDVVLGTTQLTGTKVSIRTLQNLLPELREIFGLQTVVERVGKTWTTSWALKEALNPAEIADAFGPEEQDRLVELFNRTVSANDNKERKGAAFQQSLFLTASSDRKDHLGPMRSPAEPVSGKSGSELVNLKLQPESNFVSLEISNRSVPGTFKISDLHLLHSLGLSLIPLKTKSKISLGRWSGAQRQRTSLAKLEEVFEARPNLNLAIVTGELSGVVVVDLDSAEAVEWAKEHLPQTPIRTSSSSGREHWFYRHPGGRVSNRGIVRGREDVQIKADGGYVLAPGALHPSGHVYASIGEWSQSAFSEMPVFQLAWTKLEVEDEGPIDSAEAFFGVFGRKGKK